MRLFDILDDMKDVLRDLADRVATAPPPPPPPPPSPANPNPNPPPTPPPPPATPAPAAAARPPTPPAPPATPAPAAAAGPPAPPAPGAWASPAGNPFPAGMGQPPPVAPPRPPPSPWTAFGAGLGIEIGTAAHRMNARPNNPISDALKGPGDVAATVANVAMVVPGGQVVAGIAKGVEVALKAAGQFADSVKAMGEFAEHVQAANLRFAPFNAAIASANVQLMLGDYSRNVRAGRATQDTAVVLTQSVNQMKEAWLNVDILAKDVENRRAIAGAGFSTGVGQLLDPFAAALKDALHAADPDGSGLGEWHRKAALIGLPFLVNPALGAGMAWLNWNRQAPVAQQPADAWTNFVKNAQNLKGFRPARKI